jgi:hypothetical protein
VLLTDGSCNYEKLLARLFLLMSLNVFASGLCMVYALPDALDVDGLVLKFLSYNSNLLLIMQ